MAAVNAASYIPSHRSDAQIPSASSASTMSTHIATPIASDISSRRGPYSSWNDGYRDGRGDAAYCSVRVCQSATSSSDCSDASIWRVDQRACQPVGRCVPPSRGQHAPALSASESAIFGDAAYGIQHTHTRAAVESTQESSAESRQDGSERRSICERCRGRERSFLVR